MRLTIDRLGHHGDGIAEGIFVPRTLPGEVIEGTPDGDRIAAPRIVTPSPDRVAAACPHYRACGGCAVMHARDGFVADWKTDIVRAALAAQGLEAPISGIDTSPPRSRRRAALSGRRLKGGAVVGFHARASDTVTDVPDCLLLHPAIIAGLPALRALVDAGASRKAEMGLTVTASAAGLDVAATGGKPLDMALRQDLAALVEAHRIARLVWDAELVAQRDPPMQRFGTAQVLPPPGAFLQATEDGEAALLRHVLHTVGAARQVVDLFSGCGTFALPLSAQAQVHAVEGSAQMVAALADGWRRAGGLHRLTTEARDLFRRPLDPAELNRFDAVVIDPPRAGAEAQVRAIADARVAVIAYVSCNAATFARDARILCGSGFRLADLQVVDQFRWSSHVELAAAFHRDHMDAGKQT